MQLNLSLKRLDAAFIVCLLIALTVPLLFPALRLTFFAPFLIICCYRKTLTKCLWLALLCGVIIDLLSSYTRFGLFSLDYCVSLLILYPQRRNFFADSVSTLPIMTFFFAIISTLIMALLLYSIESINIFSWGWAFTDLLIMPFIDGIYAFLVFTFPALLFGKPARRGRDYFFTSFL